MKDQHPTVIAIAFCAMWVTGLCAGADHPPPGRFLWNLVPIVGACAVIVYLRVPIYASWSRSHRPFRALLVLLDGAAAGFIVGVAVMLFALTGKPAIKSMHIADIMIWHAVLAAVGIFNAIAVYALAAFFQRCKPGCRIFFLAGE
jgi:hypothetical protein